MLDNFAFGTASGEVNAFIAVFEFTIRLSLKTAILNYHSKFYQQNLLHVSAMDYRAYIKQKLLLRVVQDYRVVMVDLSYHFEFSSALF